MKKLLSFMLILFAFVGCAKNETLTSLPPTTSTDTKLVRDSSASNLKQLGLATLQYAEKNGYKLPDFSTPETFRSATMPFVLKNGGKEEIFVEPRTGELYLPNASLSNADISAMSNPATTIMLFEKTPSALGTRGVLYVDGHYQPVAESEWSSLKTSSGIK